MADIQGAEGAVLLKEGTVIGGRGQAYTNIVALAGALAEAELDIVALVGDNVVITGLYAEGDGTNDFEVSLKTGAHGSTVWFTVGAAAKVLSLSGLFNQSMHFRSTSATSVKVLLTIAIEPGVQPPAP